MPNGTDVPEDNCDETIEDQGTMQDDEEVLSRSESEADDIKLKAKILSMTIDDYGSMGRRKSDQKERKILFDKAVYAFLGISARAFKEMSVNDRNNTLVNKGLEPKGDVAKLLKHHLRTKYNW